ncbi:hypothetical protein HY988_03325 [Candidatus Micrarchaeota archaeon]|nr:hypothetical protein [Candidatus Micrarchaeota archaeon]
MGEELLIEKAPLTKGLIYDAVREALKISSPKMPQPIVAGIQKTASEFAMEKVAQNQDFKPYVFSFQSPREAAMFLAEFKKKLGEKLEDGVKVGTGKDFVQVGEMNLSVSGSKLTIKPASVEAQEKVSYAKTTEEEARTILRRAYEASSSKPEGVEQFCDANAKTIMAVSDGLKAGVMAIGNSPGTLVWRTAIGNFLDAYATVLKRKDDSPDMTFKPLEIPVPDKPLRPQFVAAFNEAAKGVSINEKQPGSIVIGEKKEFPQGIVVSVYIPKGKMEFSESER